MGQIKTGLECFIETPPDWIKGQNLGLLCNPASTDKNFVHARELINNRFPGQLKALYSPQHGFFAEKQDNMMESDHIKDPVLNIPVFSLYGKVREPSKDMLEPVDILIIDLQDAGTRVYTFIYTMSYCLEAAKKYKKKVIVLDRPNPVNGCDVEGNCLCSEYASFVGRYPIPMRHGLTIGELACLFNEHFNIGCDLQVIPMKAWKRQMFFNDTGLVWIPPSPNLPTPLSAIVYPGQVLFEGTNISEARGTTQPFELFGAPFLDTQKIISYFGENKLPGTVLRPLVFEPVSNKWAKKPCKGFQIHVTNPDQYKPYITSIKLIQAILHNHKDQFKWNQLPYEYEYEKLAIDLIIGSKKIREKIEALEDVDLIEKSWADDLETYKKISQNFHIY